MTTREEQVAAAERIVELNLEWTMPRSLCPTHSSGVSIEWRNTAQSGYWIAYGPRATLLRDRRGGAARRFHSPGAAIRALGLSIRESPDE